LISTGVFGSVDPVHRRIDFGPPLSFEILRQTTGQLPVEANSAAPAVAALVSFFNTPACPYANDLAPLQAFEAPAPRPPVDVAVLANRVLDLLLKMDIIPILPLSIEICDIEAAHLLKGVVTPAGVALEDLVADWGIGKIRELHGPISDIPKPSHPEAVVEEILWEFVLPDLPLKWIDLDELMEDALDELEFPGISGDAREDEIVRLLTRLPKRRIRPLDRLF
jgi:hypothetical protein